MLVIQTPSVDIRHAALMATLAGGLLWPWRTAMPS